MKATTLSSHVILSTLGISIVVWLIIALSHLLTSHFDALHYQSEKVLSVNEFLYYGFAYSSWAILCTLLYCVIRQSPQKNLIKTFLLLAIGCIIIWLPSFFLYDALVYALVFKVALKTPLDTLANTPNALYFLYSILSFFCLATCAAIVSYQRSKQAAIAELAAAKKQAETALALSQQQFQLLQSQMSPHFLFNCLSAISALIRTDDKEKLLSSVSRIGALLRYATNASKLNNALLEEELNFVNDYVALQKLRFEERFTYELKVQITSANLVVIPLLLQPLVENTFHHGVAHTQERVNILLSITEHHDHLEIHVCNSHPNSNDGGWGITMQNLKERLKIAYPNKHEMRISSDQEHFSLTLILPLVEFNSHANS